MKRRNHMLNGVNAPKLPSKAEVKALVERRKKEERELVEKMNIPPRDEERYPMPDKESIAKAASFIYTLGALAESYDGNLKALVWNFYVDLMECVRRDSGQDELFSMIKTLTELKAYLASSKNPLFTNVAPAADVSEPEGK